jgi:uncharacterized protein DUF4062
MTDVGTVRRAKPKYQVFISSTWDDLKDVRAKVTWEVLAAGHIPAGMENFPATDERGWDIIRRTIDRSDYYLIIVAGRYGTYDPEIEMSWTHREYDYARSQGIPVLAFIRERSSIFATDLDKEEDNRKRLAEFIALLSEKHLKQPWRTQDDLATKVVHALRSHIDNDEEDGNPRPGWYRGDQIASAASLDEFARLSAENADLKAKLEKLQGEPSEKLLLVNRDGSPADDTVAQVTRVSVSFPDEDRYQFAVMRRERRAVQHYATLKGQTHWLELAIENTGAKAARNVVADFTFSGCSEVSIHEIEEPPDGPLVVAAHGRPFYFRTDESCFVDEYSKRSVRQRLKLVGARGGRESLVRMGICADLSIAEGMTVAYTIRSEDGVVSEGTFRIRLDHGDGDIVTLTEDQVFGRE